MTCTCSTSPAICPKHDYIPPELHAEFAPKRATDEMKSTIAESGWNNHVVDDGIFYPNVTYRRLRETLVEDLPDTVRSRFEQVQSETAELRDILNAYLTAGKEFLERHQALKAKLASEKEHSNAMAKDICQLQDSLGCPCEMTNQDGSIRDNQIAAMERIRDLIASEGELGDAKEKIEQLKLDYSNLISANKVMSEKLTDQIQIYVARVEKMEKALNAYQAVAAKFIKRRNAGEVRSNTTYAELSNCFAIGNEALNQ